MSTDTFAIPSPTGTTRLFAVVGNPIEQVMAPSLMNRLFMDRSIDAVLVPAKAEPSGVAAVIEGLKAIGNLGGILVTVPHKFAACAHADHLSERAILAQSANALRREADDSWSADNFDGTGFVAGLLKAGHAVAGKMVSLVGAGGAGVSIAVALMLAGTADLTITDIDEGRMAALADRLAQRWPGRIRASSGAITGDVMINATPIGLQAEDPLPFSVDDLPPRTVVTDIIMKPVETRLLATARARGLRVHPGLPMLTEQIELYRQFFRLP